MRVLGLEEHPPSVFVSPHTVHLAHGIARKVAMASFVAEHCRQLVADGSEI